MAQGYGLTPYGQNYGDPTMTITKEVTLEFSEDGALTVLTQLSSAGSTNPYGGVEVTVSDTNGDYSSTKTTDDTGAAVFDQLQTDTSYEIVGRAPDSDIADVSKTVDFTEP